MAEVVVVYHSAKGRTRRLAEAVCAGVRDAGADAHPMSVDEPVDWERLANADAIVFGCPTYMGSVSAPLKRFMDQTREVWAARRWQDKLAAGFTHSWSLAGDKQNVLVQLATFAAQHGMVWISLGALPGRELGDVNRFGASLGMMASSGDAATPPEGDVRTAHHLGKRVARAAQRWAERGRVGASTVEPSERHPATAHWVFPPADRAPFAHPRVNLRELVARRERFEHHLLVVATIGDAQLEVATASEPLYFAHLNISDEYALAMTTGDGAADAFGMLTLLTDAQSGVDVARYKHRAGDVVLHPYGLKHWPGRLRPPHQPFRFGPGQRRCVYSLVFCGNRPVVPDARPLFASRADAPKAYVGSPPLLHCDTRTERARRVGVIGNATMDLVVEPATIALLHGGYVVVLEGDAPCFPGDLIHLAPGASCSGDGIARALVVTASVDADPPPELWQRLPSSPWECFENGARVELPLELDGMRIEADGDHVRVMLDGATARVPRHWLARMLFRTALHGFRMGYLETYGGFFYDDRSGMRIGIGDASIPADPASLERLYRAVAPDDYRERLDD